MDWKPTQQEPEFSGRWKRPSYGGKKNAANHRVRFRWVWLFSFDEGVEPYKLQQIWYDGHKKPYINVMGQDRWSFIRWDFWASLELPAGPVNLTTEGER